MMDVNETPEAAAIRETFEETGYQIRQLQPIGRFFSSPGGTSERVFLYFAEVGDADRTGQGGGIDSEDIKIVEMAIDDLFDRLAQGVDRGSEAVDRSLLAARSAAMARTKRRRLA